MIKNFELFINTKFIFGDRSENQIGIELAANGIKSVLIHHDSGEYLETSGLLNRIRASLMKSDIKYFELGGVQPNPRLSLVREGIHLVQSYGIDGVVAIGGGSVIDSGKAIALGAANECDVWDFFTGVNSPEHSLPLASVLTLPASGSESSKVVVINNDDTKQKMLLSSPVVRPQYAFMNPNLSISVPSYPTACGIVDMYSHVCERYFNDDYEWGVIDRMCEGVLKTLVDIGPRCLKQLDDYSLRAQLMWISTIAQNNTLSIGRDEDWSTHLIANEISALYDTPHGATLSIIMGSWMRFASEHAPRRFARYAQNVFDIYPGDTPDDEAEEKKLALLGIEATESFFRSLNMPVTFKEAKIPDDNIELMLDRIPFSKSDETIGSIVKLNRHDCESIFKDAFG